MAKEVETAEEYLVLRIADDKSVILLGHIYCETNIELGPKLLESVESLENKGLISVIYGYLGNSIGYPNKKQIIGIDLTRDGRAHMEKYALNNPEKKSLILSNRTN